MITDPDALFRHFGITGEDEAHRIARLNKIVYKNTDCGAWVQVHPDRVVIGSIVEGSDAEVPGCDLPFPFDIEAWDETIQYVEDEADLLWREANED